MTKEKKRYIPKAVSDEVQKRHFFECAWCGVHLSERHHITEFHKEGEHSVDNLILLCPNCHTIVHNGGIPTEELIKRKSNHKKCDRIMGNLKTNLETSDVMIGNDYFKNCRHHIVIPGISILDVVVQEKNLLVFCKFFDLNGNLIFWMNRTYFWSEVEATVSYKLDFLEISNPDDEFYLKIERVENYLKIDLKTYLFGNLFQTDPNGVLYTNGNYSVYSQGDFYDNCEGCLFIPIFPKKKT